MRIYEFINCLNMVYINCFGSKQLREFQTAESCTFNYPSSTACLKLGLVNWFLINNSRKKRLLNNF